MFDPKNSCGKEPSTVEVVINEGDRNKDVIVVKSGDKVVKEIPAVIFDPQEADRLFALIAEPA